MKPIFKYLLFSLPLVACGGSPNDAPPPVKSEPNTNYSSLEETRLEPGPLRQASAVELALLMKNGFRISLKNNANFDTLVRNSMLASPALTVNDSKAEGIFSGTNIQVAGVDEADIVKYDGKYIYQATPVEHTDTGPLTRLKITATDPVTAATTDVSTLQLDAGSWGDVSGLYLVGDQQSTSGVVSIRRSLTFMTFAKPAVVENPSSTDLATDEPQRLSLWRPEYMDNGIEVTLYDVRTPATPSKSWSLTLDGDLLGTRKIGNTLYIISSFVPSIQSLDYADETQEVKIANEQLITQTPVEKLLPEYSINGGTSQPLNSSAGCLVPSDTTSTNGHLNLINITAVNLSSQQLIESVCINGNIDGIYSSLDNLYLGGSSASPWKDWRSFSVVHKFSLDTTGVTYQASGSVEGTLGWNQPSFRMDEHNNYLRMVTTQYGINGEPVHALNVLQKVSGRSELAVIAKLPNEAQPEPIGKPREDIYSVRFNGDQAYIVTFERKDPLYVLDLSVPNAPKIAGQLEIPGYSTYLHPVGDHYLFSLGNETDANGNPSGVKLALFDIRDITNPTLITKHVYGNGYSWSDALYDSHALSFLSLNSDQVRITLPITLYENVIENNALTSRWLNTSLHLFEINGLSRSTAALEQVGEILGESNSAQGYPLWSGSDRGIMHDNAVFYVHGPKVIGSPWKQTK